MPHFKSQICSLLNYVNFEFINHLFIRIQNTSRSKWTKKDLQRSLNYFYRRKTNWNIIASIGVVVPILMLKVIYVPTEEAHIVGNIEALDYKTNKRYEMRQMKIDYLVKIKKIKNWTGELSSICLSILGFCFVFRVSLSLVS